MRAVFLELPAFARYRAEYLDDEDFGNLKNELMINPEAGAVIEGTGGLRKLRQSDKRRGKGKRGGLRVIYYWWDGGAQFWLFALYNKDEAADLDHAQKVSLRGLLKSEMKRRSS